MTEDFPCQGGSDLCTGGGAPVAFGLCPECSEARRRHLAVLDLGSALREGRAPWAGGELRDFARLPAADVVPPRPAWVRAW